MIQRHAKIVLTGAAGLVGQNLATLLREQGYTNLVGIDKHHNTGVLRRLNPDMTVIETDLAKFFEYGGQVSTAWIWTRIKRFGTARACARSSWATSKAAPRRWSAALSGASPSNSKPCAASCPAAAHWSRSTR